MQLSSVNRLEMCLLQSRAAGMFKHRMPRETDTGKPASEVSLLIRIARPVNPLESRLAGSMKLWITKV